MSHIYLLSSTSTSKTNMFPSKYLDILKKDIFKRSKLSNTNYFNNFVSDEIQECIHNHDMSSFIVCVELVGYNYSGFNTMNINIVKSIRCKELTIDEGDGFIDENWRCNNWIPFMKDINVILNKHYEVIYTGKFHCTVNRKYL